MEFIFSAHKVNIHISF